MWRHWLAGCALDCTALDGHICGLVVTALWSEEIISISLVTARNNTAYCQHVVLAMFVLRQGGVVVTPHNGLHSGGLTLDQESFQIINREMVWWCGHTKLARSGDRSE